jgi:hypothetical protein
MVLLACLLAQQCVLLGLRRSRQLLTSGPLPVHYLDLAHAAGAVCGPPHVRSATHSLRAILHVAMACIDVRVSGPRHCQRNHTIVQMSQTLLGDSLAVQEGVAGRAPAHVCSLTQHGARMRWRKALSRTLLHRTVKIRMPKRSPPLSCARVSRKAEVAKLHQQRSYTYDWYPWQYA